ncbi:MAG: ABC transporter permease, partial [Planctomycetes bacterium]|nr:ABC transporter permease [Planctomycetota bacterium]
VVYYQAPISRLAPVPQDELDHESINANALIAERFSITILVLQNIAVLILMPIYVASSVYEEHDKRMLPVLFTTDLSAGEMVRGKWLARVVLVGSVLPGGLPVLSFAQLWGGIDMPMIAANFLNTASWLFSVGAFSMMMATQSGSLAYALFKTYGWILATVLVISCCCVPLEFHGELVFLLRPFQDKPYGYEAMWVIAGLLALLHVGLTWVFLRVATGNLDGQRGDAPAPPELFDAPDDPWSNAHRDTESIPDDALEWKEQRHRTVIFALPLLAMPYLALAVLAQLPSCFVQNEEFARTERTEAHIFFLIMALFSVGVHLLLIAMRMAGCIVGERERQTLDSLRMLPLSPTELLWAKVKGNLLRHWTWLLPLCFYWPLVLLMSRWNPLGAFVLLIVLASHYSFFAMLGLFLSVVCRSSVSAYSLLALILLLLVIGTSLTQWMFPRFELEWMQQEVNPVGMWLLAVDLWRNGYKC